MWRKSLLALLMLLALAGCGAETKGDDAVAPPPPPEEAQPEEAPVREPDPAPAPDPREAAVEALLAEMSLEEKVGQMFFAQCPALRAEEKIREYHLGGVLLFTRDFQDGGGEWLSADDFVLKVQGFQGAASVPLLIGVDEEGGTVARASRNPNLFLEKRRSPQEVYLAGGLAAIGQDTLEVNGHLLGCGINVNFAPVADVSTDPADFIYDRSFGQDPEATAEYVRTVVDAVGTVAARDQSLTGPLYRMGCVLKHFPGYGDNADTHTGIALDARPYSQFLAEDFLPFRAVIGAGAGAVLVSHNIITCMDENFPASLSPEVHRVLREELGFQGVVLTDDLAMDAVEAYAEDGSVAVLAVLAGNDMIVTADFETQIPLVADAVRTGLVDEGTIDAAVRRVLGWKYDLGLIQ
ncbi:MAG: beta-hexosaminidase [Oscillospiraceae bacterium]|nr:beta-hexosaminidase [Oscillospiraceae bacterium]